MTARAIKLRWTCSDFAGHAHRYRWTAWACGRAQRLRDVVGRLAVSGSLARAGLLFVAAAIILGAVPGFQSMDGHNFLAYYGIVILGAWLMPVPKSIRFFVTVAAASCWWLQFMVANVDRKYTFTFVRLYTSANSDFQFIVLFAGLYAVVRYLRPGQKLWLDFLCWVALIECLRISCQRLGWDPVYVPMNAGRTITEAAGSQGNIGWTGMVLAMCAPGFFRPRIWWGLLPVAAALYIQTSITPVVALSGGTFVWAWIRFGRVHALTAALAGVLLLALYNLYVDPIYAPGGGLWARGPNWARAVDLCVGREAWLLGYGLGSWRFLFPTKEFSFFRAHCDPLQVWFELGWFGVLAMLLYARFLILRVAKVFEAKRLGFRRTTESGAVAAAAVAIVILCSLGNFPFHTAGCAVIAVGWLAMFDGATSFKIMQAGDR